MGKIRRWVQRNNLLLKNLSYRMIRNICYYNVKQNTIAKIHFDLLEYHTYECSCLKDLCNHDHYALGKKGETRLVDGHCYLVDGLIFAHGIAVNPGPCKTDLYGKAGGWSCFALDQSS